MDSNAKEKILSRIKQALKTSVPVPFQEEGNEPMFTDSPDEPEVLFAENFTKLLGRFSFCENTTDLSVQLKQLFQTQGLHNIYCKEPAILETLNGKGMVIEPYNDLGTCDASITSCEALVGRTGSILLSSATGSGRTASIYAPIHICIAYTNQVVFDIKDALQRMRAKYGNELPSLLTFATGPSRTADIEKTLVVGVHGPKEVYCFLVQTPNA